MLSITIREMQIRTTVKYHLTPVKTAIIKKPTNNSGENVKKRDSSCTVCWWECKFIQPLWRTVSIQLLNHVQLFATPWTAAHQASLSITSSRSLYKLMSIELVMPFNLLILCRPFLLLSWIFPSIRVFSNESYLHIRWPKYCINLDVVKGTPYE